MPSPSVPHSQELLHTGARLDGPGDSARAGHWQLACGHAMGLHPRRGGLLSIGRGAVWLTVSGPGARGVDQFLGEGETFVIAAGQHAVMEPWAGHGRAPEAVAFTWAETEAERRSSGRSGAGAGTVRSACIAFASSLREALHAQAEVGRALLGLARAVVAWRAGRSGGDVVARGH